MERSRPDADEDLRHGPAGALPDLRRGAAYREGIAPADRGAGSLLADPGLEEPYFKPCAQLGCGEGDPSADNRDPAPSVGLSKHAFHWGHAGTSGGRRQGRPRDRSHLKRGSGHPERAEAGSLTPMTTNKTRMLGPAPEPKQRPDPSAMKQLLADTAELGGFTRPSSAPGAEPRGAPQADPIKVEEIKAESVKP